MLGELAPLFTGLDRLGTAAAEAGYRVRYTPHMELDRRGAELLFHVLTEREERFAVTIASTKPSPAGPRPSPALGSARPSSTD